MGQIFLLGTNPSKVIKGRGKKIEIRERGRKPVVFEADDPVDVLKEIALYKPVDAGLPRFSGGLVGYMGYDMVRFFERVLTAKTRH